MTSDRWSTHAITVGPAGVTKRFRATDHDRCAREWRALRLLSRYAPGLAPEPLRADLAAREPTVVMSGLAGAPLRGAPLTAGQVEALAAAVAAVHGSLPPDVLASLPPRPGRPEELSGLVRSWYPRARPQAGDQVGRAMDDGMDWLSGSVPETGGPPDVPWVFGPGDGNLANYLWDGSRVQVVDFEDSGRSDRAFELAEITEHAAAWVEVPLDVPRFLRHCDLTPAESVRLPHCRRLLALVWLFLLSFDAATGAPRNPPGTAERQAGRLRDLLG
ncbi:phosphotransferase [Actinacidiphila paucisporea]|uniref:Phosphotransferase enzyme family protein n=1 Tax=Actinacidiphila paucisporea TaxID=310782 RepID=A0A1M7NQC4_9ACTN|nr:phosphotransferase [Actinacidiphila paucisporea]SHN06310.1 Phosphotransferase enzyme family protein [Actinacidiphila paucisporea]